MGERTHQRPRSALRVFLQVLKLDRDSRRRGSRPRGGCAARGSAAHDASASAQLPSCRQARAPTPVVLDAAAPGGSAAPCAAAPWSRWRVSHTAMVSPEALAGAAGGSRGVALG